MRVAFIVLLALSGFAQTNAEPFHIKDDVLGESLSEWQRNHQQPLSKFLYKCGHHKQCKVMDCTLPDSAATMPLEGSADSIQSCTNLGWTHIRTYDDVFTVRYADQIAQFQRISFLHQRLYEVLYAFDHEAFFSTLRDSLIAKFGAPSNSSTETMQNRMGATIVGQVLVWHNSVSTITLYEYSSDVNTSNLVFSLDELEKEASAMQKQAIVGRAIKDM